MRPTRRHVLQIGGGFLAGLAWPGSPFARAGWSHFLTANRSHFAEKCSNEPVEIRMQGKADGSHVWFDPVGLHVQPGRTIRWINRDPGNSHTATAYHPKYFERPLRIPERAEPWNSDYLLPDESFSVTLTVEGVYDFYCIPHEHAGMVGRIIVGNAGSPPPDGSAAQALPDIALQAFPSIDEIMRKGIVRRT